MAWSWPDPRIRRLRRALVAPRATTIGGLPSEVVLEPGDDPIGRRCAVNLDSIESVSTAVLTDRIVALSVLRMEEIGGALEVAVDCRSLTHSDGLYSRPCSVDVPRRLLSGV